MTLSEPKHSHYFKNVAHLTTIDVYRVLELFNVTDPAIQHAVKKLLVAGGRGAGKDIKQDIQESIDTLLRWQSMQSENASSQLWRGFARHKASKAATRRTHTPAATAKPKPATRKPTRAQPKSKG